MLVSKMGRIVLTIPDDLEQKFRNAVFRRYGMRRGNLTKAVKEAIEQWVLSVEKETRNEHTTSS
jgi:metal-responsive CopG/Arc/MetJ family transcriptional regulator